MLTASNPVKQFSAALRYSMYVRSPSNVDGNSPMRWSLHTSRRSRRYKDLCDLGEFWAAVVSPGRSLVPLVW
jgi:hypothetical protein